MGIVEDISPLTNIYINPTDNDTEHNYGIILDGFELDSTGDRFDIINI